MTHHDIMAIALKLDAVPPYRQSNASVFLGFLDIIHRLSFTVLWISGFRQVGVLALGWPPIGIGNEPPRRRVGSSAY
jgi:hypothetical protein